MTTNQAKMIPASKLVLLLSSIAALMSTVAVADDPGTAIGWCYADPAADSCGRLQTGLNDAKGDVRAAHCESTTFRDDPKYKAHGTRGYVIWNRTSFIIPPGNVESVFNDIMNHNNCWNRQAPDFACYTDKDQMQNLNCT
ncbi:hypothetical protein BCV70DRAFT_123373 [Testicularia cyperi]|uniref:Secreted protein n=1 Tax=Testicularia cyperi TaxID=1882483 RepID=A0A317XNU3_9BASI|nr:hypothetical protein BCV70DRAFT_123373 [Testicularia cyperi]